MALPGFVANLDLFSLRASCAGFSSGRVSTTTSGSVLIDLRFDEDDSFGDGVAGCLEAPLDFVWVAFAVGGVEELSRGGQLGVLVGSLSCCGFGFLWCFAGPPGALALALFLMHAWYFGP